MITILDGNAFYLRITGKTKVGEYEATLDLEAIDSLIVNFVRRVRESQTVTHDQGKVLAYNDGKLAKGVYGVEMVGYYNGQPWRFYAPEVFEIADDGETEASNVIGSVNVYDVTFYMKLGGDGVTPGYVDAAVTMHNTSEEAHTDMREAIVGLRTQVGRRLVGAKVTFSDGHTEDVELGLNDQGEVILLLPKETLGKIDGVKVNGDELPVDDNGKVDIPIPTTVHDLDPEDEYATKEETQAMVDEAKGIVSFRNYYAFLSLSHLAGRYAVVAGDKTLAQGQINLDTPAGETEELTLNLGAYPTGAMLNFTFVRISCGGGEHRRKFIP